MVKPEKKKCRLWYNVQEMKETEYRNIMLLMNQESLIAYERMLEHLSFLLSVRKVFDGKDDWEEEKRFSDSIAERVYDTKEVILNNIRSSRSDSKKLNSLLEKSKVIPINLTEDIHTVLDMKEEQSNILETIYTPDDLTKDAFTACFSDFLLRMAIVYRVDTWIFDIADGIQEYGVAPFLLPENDNEDMINILDGVYELKDDELKNELLNKILIKDNDDDSLIQDKINIKQLIEKAEKLLN